MVPELEYSWFIGVVKQVKNNTLLWFLVTGHGGPRPGEEGLRVGVTKYNRCQKIGIQEFHIYGRFSVAIRIYRKQSVSVRIPGDLF